MNKECEVCVDGERACEECFKKEAEIQLTLYQAQRHLKQFRCSEENPCEEGDSHQCCEHGDSRDHGICIDCGHEEDPGEAIDRAMDYLEDR